MPITLHERAAHTLRVKAAALAHEATSALYRLRPELEHRYGESGRLHCTKDIGHHLRFLAAAVEIADAKVFVDYAAWAARVMVTHNVATEDAVASFRCLLAVVPGSVSPESSPLVCEIISAALASLDAHPPASGIPVRPRRARKTVFAAPSTTGSVPSRS